MKKSKFVNKLRNTGDCFCRYWTIPNIPYDFVDEESLAFEQYSFFPVVNNCVDGTEPVCYGEGNGNCVCEDVKDLKYDCDSIHKLCPPYYRCDVHTKYRTSNTHDCGDTYDKPCIGVCRKDTENDTPNPIPIRKTTRTVVSTDNETLFSNVSLDANQPNLISFPFVKSYPSGLSNEGNMYTVQELFENMPSINYIIGPSKVAERIGVSDNNPNGMWIGSLSHIDPRVSYWVENESVDDIISISIEEQLPFFQRYNLYYGNNFISYPRNQEISIEEAITPEARLYLHSIQSGDSEVTTYYEGMGWIGNLESFQPGKGYIFTTKNLAPMSEESGHRAEVYQFEFGGVPFEDRDPRCNCTFYQDLTGCGDQDGDGEGPDGSCIPGPNPFNGVNQIGWEYGYICVTNELGLGGGGCYNPGDGSNGQLKYVIGASEGTYYDKPGCMDPYSPNYTAPPDAFWHDEELCDYMVYGCTDEDACNYNPDAIEDDDSCIFNYWYEDTDGDGLGCPDLMIVSCNNPNPEVYVDNNEGDCDDCPFNYDQCGVCGGDGTSCVDCTDPTACNYNPDATIDDGSCSYIGDPGYECDCEGTPQILYYSDADGDGIGCCDDAIYFCENPGENWSLTCGEEGAYCECPAGTHEVDTCGVCYPIDEPAPNQCIGCTNPFALNYSPLKSIDDGSCIYDWSNTLYMKMYYWSDDGFCGEPRGICTYEVLLRGECPGNQVECWDGSCADNYVSCPPYCDEIGMITCSNGFCAPTFEDCVYNEDYILPDELTPDYNDPPGGDTVNQNQSVLTHTIEATEWQCAHLEELDIDAVSSEWEYNDSLYQPFCSEEDPLRSIIYIYPDSEEDSIQDGGNFSTSLTDEGSLCPGSWSWNLSHSALTFSYRSESYFTIGDSSSQTEISYNDLVNGFHGLRYRYDRMTDTHIPGKFYVRKWDFHPMLKGGPDAVFTDRVWSIDMYIDQFESNPIKSLPIFNSDRTWHSMNGSSQGEFEINTNRFMLHYKNPSNNTCCFPDTAVYKSDSPLIGGGLVCDSYNDNIDGHKFPGCRSVIHAPQVQLSDYISDSNNYLYSQIYPGQYRMQPVTALRRKWEYIYENDYYYLREVTTGRCDSSGTNLWFYGENGEHDNDAHIPQRQCIGLPFGNAVLGDINQDGVLNVLDVVMMVNGILSGDELSLLEYGDINQDGIVDILDVVQLVLQILQEDSRTSYSFNAEGDVHSYTYTKQELTRFFQNMEIRLQRNKKNNQPKLTEARNKKPDKKTIEKNKLIESILRKQGK